MKGAKINKAPIVQRPGQSPTLSSYPEMRAKVCRLATLPHDSPRAWPYSVSSAIFARGTGKASRGRVTGHSAQPASPSARIRTPNNCWTALRVSVCNLEVSLTKCDLKQGQFYGPRRVEKSNLASIFFRLVDRWAVPLAPLVANSWLESGAWYRPRLLWKYPRNSG